MTATILPALKLLAREGMRQDGPLKIRMALKHLEREARRHDWDDERLESYPPEWQWRICTARLMLGCLDWRGWQWRRPRAGHDPFEIPRWKCGLPIYPIQHEVSEPEHVGSLLVYSEQGIGDQIMFAQALHYAEPYADSITVEIEPRLAPIFERSFPNLHIQPLEDLRDASWVKPGEFDAKILIGDLVARFIRSKEAMRSGRYLEEDELLVEKWADWICEVTPLEGQVVGFSWKGRQGYIDPGIADEGWIDLQYTEHETPPNLIRPPGINLKEDLEDVFAILGCCDRIVTVPNTLAHMAGALGIPCDVIMVLGSGEINNAVNYRWGMPGEGRMPWHDSIRVFRSVKEWQRAR